MRGEFVNCKKKYTKMKLFPSVEKRYTKEKMTAPEAQRLAQFIAWGPVVFQVSRLMVKWGVLEAINKASNGLTKAEIAASTGLSDYAVDCLLEASLSIGTIVVNAAGDRYSISKTGWFLLNDEATRVNMDFNHDVNYEGLFHLEESLRDGKPEGLKHFGNWTTIYEALSELPPQVQQSWFAFDHFYSDGSFPAALKIVFDEHQVRTLYDVGGNTGRWALACVAYREDARVTILDLPQQIKMMEENIAGKQGADRISGHAIDLLDAEAQFPTSSDGPDAIWMSQFLDCFSQEQIVSILKRAKEAMGNQTRIYIMETLWDRQRFETASLCLTMTSLYFAAMANGNSKMYHSEDLEHCISLAGLEIEQTYDHLGLGHTIIVCKNK